MNTIITDISNLLPEHGHKEDTLRSTQAYRGVIIDVVSLIFLFHHFNIQNKAVISLNTYAELSDFTPAQIYDVRDIVNVQIHELEKNILAKINLRYGIDLTKSFVDGKVDEMYDYFSYNDFGVKLKKTKMTTPSSFHGIYFLINACKSYYFEVETLLRTEYNIDISGIGAKVFNLDNVFGKMDDRFVEFIECGIYKPPKDQEIKNSFEDIEYE